MATTEDESINRKPDLEALSSKMLKLPQEILMAHLPVNPDNQKFKPNMPDYEFSLAKTNLADRINQFSSLFEKSLEYFSLESDNELRSQFERKCVDCLRNSCSVEFLSNFGRELAALSTFSEALSFLDDIFGEQSQEDRKEKALLDLENLTRRTDQNEKFTSFLKRIKTLAAQINEKADAQSFIVEQKFKKNLEPSNLSFLKDHGFHRESCEKISEFLDSRERHCLAQISAVSGTNVSSEIESFMGETKELLSEQLAAIYANNRKVQEDHEKKYREFSETIKELKATVAKLEISKSKTGIQELQEAKRTSRPQFFQNSSFSTPPQSYQTQQFSPQGFQQRPRFQAQNFQQSGPPFCNLCQQFGHYKRRCNQVICHFCGEQGHVQRDCRRQQFFQNSPRAQTPQNLNSRPNSGNA